MEKLKQKYANVILKNCLHVKKNQPLFISANIETIDFVRIVANEAYKLGVKDIYFDLSSPYLKHDALLNLDEKSLKQSQHWNKEKWTEYAKKGAAFVMLASETPGLMKDIDPKKLSKMSMYALETRKEFDEMRDKMMVPWCIAAVPTTKWADQVFPESKDAVNDLWKAIFDICKINNSDPNKVWDEKIKRLQNTSNKLTKYNFTHLHYQNNLGTDFTIGLPKNHLWTSGRQKLVNGLSVLVNFPTEEIFTSPTNNSAEGIVYASKPLNYQDNLIEDFWIKFAKGRVTECHASKGEETLKELIASCKNCDRIGEVALVEYDSPISASEILFYETLFDENAACHLALGASFPECIENGPAMSRKELSTYKLNDCQNHVDFMIGTEDLTVTGITEDKREIPIFVDGNFTDEFKS